MNHLPQRRKRTRSGIRDNDGPIRCPGHLQLVRGLTCAACTLSECAGRIEVAHVRIGTDGGMGQRPGDNWVVPLCSLHHEMQHRLGEVTFWARVGLDPHAVAAALWAASPHRIKYEAKRRGDR